MPQPPTILTDLPLDPQTAALISEWMTYLTPLLTFAGTVWLAYHTLTKSYAATRWAASKTFRLFFPATKPAEVIGPSATCQDVLDLLDDANCDFEQNPQRVRLGQAVVYIEPKTKPAAGGIGVTILVPAGGVEMPEGNVTRHLSETDRAYVVAKAEAVRDRLLEEERQLSETVARHELKSARRLSRAGSRMLPTGAVPPVKGQSPSPSPRVLGPVPSGTSCTLNSNQTHECRGKGGAGQK